MKRKKIRRKQEYGAVKIIYDANLERRVRFIQNGTDGTFGFVEEVFREFDDYSSWSPAGDDRGSRLKTMEEAVREAMGRVAWLAAELDRSPQ